MRTKITINWGYVFGGLAALWVAGVSYVLAGSIDAHADLKNRLENTEIKIGWLEHAVYGWGK